MNVTSHFRNLSRSHHHDTKGQTLQRSQPAIIGLGNTASISSMKGEKSKHFEAPNPFSLPGDMDMIALGKREKEEHAQMRELMKTLTLSQKTDLHLEQTKRYLRRPSTPDAEVVTFNAKKPDTELDDLTIQTRSMFYVWVCIVLVCVCVCVCVCVLFTSCQHYTHIYLKILSWLCKLKAKMSSRSPCRERVPGRVHQEKARTFSSSIFARCKKRRSRLRLFLVDTLHYIIDRGTTKPLEESK